ncbi:MAG: hypothetical protein RQ875_14775 [Vicingaceae bacterium]|nr:hypothetical protein [Vicingaceae bacterium]
MDIESKSVAKKRKSTQHTLDDVLCGKATKIPNNDIVMSSIFLKNNSRPVVMPFIKSTAGSNSFLEIIITILKSLEAQK